MYALVSTRKALQIYQFRDSKWQLNSTAFEGVKVSQTHYDASRKTIWAAVNHGHWGLKIHSSKDGGKTFQEHPSPKFPETSQLKLSDVWAIHVDAKGRIYLGTEPAHLFYSDDEGQSWQWSEAFANVPYRNKWMGGGTDQPCLHSFIEDPADPNHLVVAISCAGVLDSIDRGETWTYRNKGLVAEFLPDVEAEVGQDPHIVTQQAGQPNLLWQQNHCGIFKSEDYGHTWQNLSKNEGLISAFGWAIASAPGAPDTVITIPAHSDVKRVPVEHKLVVQRSEDGGQTWSIESTGLPSDNCYSIVYRHGLKMTDQWTMFGTSTGQLYTSRDLGKNWQTLAAHLAPIYAVELIETDTL